MNPFIQQAQGLDQQGLAPVFQNIAQQQAMHNAGLNEQNQQVAQAGQTQNPSGFNNLAMAMMLRGKQNKPTEPGTGQMYNSFGKVVQDPTYGAGTAYNNMTSGEIANMQANGI